MAVEGVGDGCRRVVYDPFTGSRICEDTGEVIEEAVISDSAPDNISYDALEEAGGPGAGGIHGVGYSAQPRSDHGGGLHLGRRPLRYGHLKAAEANVSSDTAVRRVTVARRVLTETYMAGVNLLGPISAPSDGLARAEAIYYRCISELWGLVTMKSAWYQYAPAAAAAAVFVALNGSVDPVELYEAAVASARAQGISGEMPSLFTALDGLARLSRDLDLKGCSALVRAYTEARLRSAARITVSRAARAAVEVGADPGEVARAAEDLARRLEADKRLTHSLASRKATALLALALAVAGNSEKPWGTKLAQIFNPKVKAENSYGPHNMARRVYQRHGVIIVVTLSRPSAEPRVDPKVSSAIHYACPHCGADLTSAIAEALWGAERRGKGFKYMPLVPAKKAVEVLGGYCPACDSPLEPRGYVVPVRVAAPGAADHRRGSHGPGQGRGGRGARPSGGASS